MNRNHKNRSEWQDSRFSRESRSIFVVKPTALDADTTVDGSQTAEDLASVSSDPKFLNSLEDLESLIEIDIHGEIASIVDEVRGTLGSLMSRANLPSLTGDEEMEVLKLLPFIGKTMKPLLAMVYESTDQSRREELATSLLALANRVISDKLALIKAGFDTLTGLLRRGPGENAVVSLLSRGKRGGCVLIFDMDGLKDINDTQGHGAGDRGLIAIADIISKRVRSGDIVVRLGGDEYMVFLGDPSDERVVSLPESESVGKEIQTIVSRAGYSVSVGAERINVVTNGPESNLYEAANMALVNAKTVADTRMYENKRAGNLARGQ